MKGRLLVVNPHLATKAPLAPSMILEEEGNIGFYQDGWTRRIHADRLEDVTEKDVRCSLRVRPEDVIYLSPVRELPSNDLMSPEMLRWAQGWAADFVTELKQKEPVAPSAGS